MGHRPFIAVDVQIARVEALDDLRQLLDDGLGVADDDVIDRMARPNVPVPMVGRRILTCSASRDW